MRGMMARRDGCGIVVMTAAILSAPAAVAGQMATADGSAGRWDLLDGRHAVATVAGREAFVVRSGPELATPDLSLRNGEVHVAFRFTDNARFAGIYFRRASDTEAQTIYLRPRNSGSWDALQYQAIQGGGSTWQLYSEFNATAELPIGEWIPVRLVLDGPRIALHLHGESEPTLEIPRARGMGAEGPISFWGTEFDPEGERGYAVANIEVVERPGPDPVVPPAPIDAGTGLLSQWRISDPVAVGESDLPLGASPEVSATRPVTVEEGGLVNLTREVGAPGWNGFEAVVATTTLRSDRARRVPLDVAYSSYVTVFVNGEPVYSGFDDWESRHPRYFAGTRLGFEMVWLPLVAGDNEVTFAVSETGTFGWGFRARLRDREGVSEVIR